MTQTFNPNEHPRNAVGRFTEAYFEKASVDLGATLNPIFVPFDPEQINRAQTRIAGAEDAKLNRFVARRARGTMSVRKMEDLLDQRVSMLVLQDDGSVEAWEGTLVKGVGSLWGFKKKRERNFGGPRSVHIEGDVDRVFAIESGYGSSEAMTRKFHQDSAKWDEAGVG
jgi:hypothetical protein